MRRQVTLFQNWSLLVVEQEMTVCCHQMAVSHLTSQQHLVESHQCGDVSHSHNDLPPTATPHHLHLYNLLHITAATIQI